MCVKRYAQENGLSEDTARKELLSTAAMMVDNGWNQALAGTDINAARAAQYLRTELGTGPDSNLFQVTQADYYNERVGLTALFKNKEALTSVLENIALANPASYTRDPANRAEVLNAKGEGSQAGFGLALEGIVSAPSKTALWLMGALTCSSCAERDIQNAWNSVASLPEDIRMKGYLDALHTMQGQGASVVRDNAASSTALGVEVGLAIDGGLAGAGKGVVTDGAKGSAAGAAEANNALSAAEGVVASRVNVRTGAANVTGSGLEYAWKKHGGAWGDNKSAFTISKNELKVVLQSPQVVKTPAYQSPTSGNFIRTVDMGRPIGIDAKAGGQPTNFMTVITDSKGNLVNTFPGKTF